MLLRALFSASLILLIIPLSVTPLKSHAQGGNVGEKLSFEATSEMDIIPLQYGENVHVSTIVRGEFEIFETDSPDFFDLKGNGTGTLTITDLPNDQCTGSDHTWTFPADIVGSMSILPSDGGSEKWVTIGGDYRSDFIWEPYTIECTTEGSGSSYKLERTYLGPKGAGGNALLEELTAGKVFRIDHLPGDSMQNQVVTLKISLPGLNYYVHGTVRDTAGNLILASKLVRIDFEKISNDLPLKKLSESKPEFEDQTKSDTTNARYEFRFDREAGKLDEKLLVVSLLWYDGEAEFAVTNGKEAGGRFIPVYLAQCVDNVGKDCVKWEKTDNGFEAQLDFVYGSSMVKTFPIIRPEAWQPGSGLDQLMAESALVYSNSYKAMKYFEENKGSFGVDLNPIMIKVRHQEPNCNRAEFDAKAKQTKVYPSFGDLGNFLDKVESTGSSIKICDNRSATTEKDIPVNREWHELGHYLNFEMYFNFDNRKFENHAGYANESTNDSLAEGFAEFVAMLIAEHYGSKTPYTYPIRDAIQNLETDVKVWNEAAFAERQQENGTLKVNTFFPAESFSEEFAIAGILWDLHDSGVEVNPKFVVGQDANGDVWSPTSRIYPNSTDMVSLSGERILQIISDSEPKTLAALYNSFLGEVAKEDLDMIFVNHGGFADVSDRNLIQDLTGEDAGPTGHTPTRLVRGSTPPSLPGSFLAADRDATFNVRIVHEEPFSHYDFSYLLGMSANKPAYFQMSPPYYPSKAIFDQVSSDDKTVLVANATTIESDLYWNHFRSNPKIDEIFRILPVSASSPATDNNNTETPTENNSPSQQPSGCLIATAAFGSELMPQVQFLRGFRDNYILSTASGSNFMNVFNTWYYSFSPTVADYERGQPWLQQTVRIAIQPLLGILGISEKAYSLIPGEYGSMAAGIVASSLIGATYFWPAALPIAKLKSKWVIDRVLGVLVVGAVVATALCLTLGSSVGLVISTSTLVLAAVAWSALATSMSVTTLLNWAYKRFHHQ